MNVKVYSTPTCPWCLKLKEWLKSKDVKFEDVDVSEDEEAQREMIAKSGRMGVPQIEIDGKIIVGFDQAAIEAALDGDETAEVKKMSEEEE